MKRKFHAQFLGGCGRVNRPHLPGRNAAAWLHCSPCSGQDFYDQAFVARVSPDGHVGYNWMANRHLPSPEFHWLDCQPYGLQTDNTMSTMRVCIERRTWLPMILTEGCNGHEVRWSLRPLGPDHRTCLARKKVCGASIIEKFQ